MPYKDRERQRAAEIKSQAKRQYVRRLLIREAKSQPCMDCGVQYPYYVMHLDQRPDEVKFKGLAQMQSYSIDRIKVEIDKCDPVCANCHAIRSYKRMAQSSNG